MSTSAGDRLGRPRCAGPGGGGQTRRRRKRRMAADEESPKRRKANFNEAETEVLVEQVLRHEQVLFAAGPGRASPGQKRRVWELIRHRVNPVAACPREVEDLKKRWRDLKRRGRSKLRRRLTATATGTQRGAPAFLHPASLGRLLVVGHRGGGEEEEEEEEEEEGRGEVVVVPPAEPLRAYAAAAAASGLLLPPPPPRSPRTLLPIAGGIDTLDLPGLSPSPAEISFTDDPGPSHQPFVEKLNLKEEIVVKIVEPEENSEDIAVVPPSQEQLPFLVNQNGGPHGKVKAKTKTQTDPSELTEEDLLKIQQNQLHTIQSGFDSINHNLRLLQQGMHDLNNSLSVMAHTLMVIKNVYVKNNAGPTTFANVSTQTTTGYLSPGSPLAEDRVRVPVTGSSSRSSSCSSSSLSQDPGPSELPRPPHRPIKKEHPNGCYYFCFADV